MYVRDVARGEAYGFNAWQPTYLSSTVKLVVGVEVLEEVDAGELHLSDVLEIGVDDLRDGVGPLRNLAPGARFTVQALLELMLVRSDNVAADRLIRQVGVPRLTAQLSRRGLRFGPLASLLGERRALYAELDPRGGTLTGLQIRRLGREDALGPRAAAFSRLMGRTPPWTGDDLARAFDGFYATGINSAPMEQMGLLLSQIARCEGLTPGSCARLQTWMRACRTGEHRVRAGLPVGVAWGHKTGTQFRRACDVGILWAAPGRPVVVAACTRDFDALADAERALAGVGRAAWGVARTLSHSGLHSPDAEAPGLSRALPPHDSPELPVSAARRAHAGLRQVGRPLRTRSGV